jgi:hypothetical protein
MKKRALDGLSIGYTVGEFIRGTKPNEPRRTIKTIKNLPEPGDVPDERASAHKRGQGRGHSHRARFRGRPARCARLLARRAKSIAQRGFKTTNEKPSRLDNFIASLRDVRR